MDDVARSTRLSSRKQLFISSDDRYSDNTVKKGKYNAYNDVTTRAATFDDGTKPLLRFVFSFFPSKSFPIVS